MAIAVPTFMTHIQELRKQIHNYKSSSKCLTLVSESIFYRIPLLQTHRGIKIETLEPEFSVLQTVPILFTS